MNILGSVRRLLQVAGRIRLVRPILLGGSRDITLIIGPMTWGKLDWNGQWTEGVYPKRTVTIDRLDRWSE